MNSCKVTGSHFVGTRETSIKRKSVEHYVMLC
jgi:hypothetical protein